MTLCIAKNLSLPIEAITETFAILAKRGVGKTYTAAVMVEEMLAASLPVCVLDPVGVWWGLRSSKNGKGPGYPIVIFGGDHADVPLQASAGQLIADLIIDKRLQAVLDLSLFRKGEQTRFVMDFAERVYRRNRNPLHLVLDEADAFAPQKPMRDQARMLGAIEDLVRRGRARGIGITLITQRAAVLNKNVLTQVEVLVALRTISPQDRAAVDAWIQVHGTIEQRKEMMDSLPSLPIGTAWFWSPGWLDIFKRVKVRERKTFDSSATPKVGKKIKAPSTLADVDLGPIRDAMADSIENAKTEDPKELRKRINVLERDNAKLERERDRLREQVNRYQLSTKAPTNTPAQEPKPDVRALEGLKKIHKITSSLLGNGKVQNVPSVKQTPVCQASSGLSSKPNAEVDIGELKIGEFRILRSLFWLQDEERTPVKVAFYANYTVNGHFKNQLTKLRTLGLAEGWSITEAGIQAIPDHVEVKPTGTQLREWLRPKLKGPVNKVLDTLIEAAGERLDVEELASRSGYTVNGHFKNCLTKLRALQIAEGGPREGGVRASEIFFQ